MQIQKAWKHTILQHYSYSVKVIQIVRLYENLLCCNNCSPCCQKCTFAYILMIVRWKNEKFRFLVSNHRYIEFIALQVLFSFFFLHAFLLSVQFNLFRQSRTFALRMVWSKVPYASIYYRNDLQSLKMANLMEVVVNKR